VKKEIWLILLSIKIRNISSNINKANNQDKVDSQNNLDKVNKTRNNTFHKK
jgi:hypothetical protein